MLERMLNKKFIRKVLISGVVIFLVLMAISFFAYRPLNLLNLYKAFETAVDAFTGSHGEVLEILIKNKDANPVYMGMFVLYIVFSISALVFSLYMVADLIKILFLKSKEGIDDFDEKSYVIFGFNPTVITMIENTDNIDRKDVHIVTLKDFFDEELKNLDELGVNYDCLDESNLQINLKKKKFYKVANVLLAENENMANYFIYKKLLDVKTVNKNLRISCIPTSETERLAIENDATKTVNMVGLKQAIAQSVSSTVSEVICKNISNFKNKNLKCLMVGFGDTGQNVFKMLVNQLVIDSNNTITIDIVDKDAKQVFGKAMQTVCGDYKDASGIHIAKDVADGILDVNIYNYSYNDEKCSSLMTGNKYDFVVLNILNNYRYIDFVENNRKLMAALPDTHFVVPVLQFNEYCNNMKYLKVDEDVVEIVNLHISKVYENYNLKLLKENVIEENAIKFNYHYNYIHGYAYDQKKMWSDIDSYSRKSSLFQSIHQEINASLRVLYKDEYDEKLSIVLDMLNKHRTCLEELNGDDVDRKKKKLNASFDIEMEKVINSDPLLKELAMIEHRRWTYFVIFEGWKYDKVKNKNLKHSDCITNWFLLSKDKKGVLIYDLTPFIMLIGRDAEIKRVR